MRRQARHIIRGDGPLRATRRGALLALGAVAAATIAPATTARAEEPIWADLWGYALRGYDPVAYFTVGEAVEGVSEHRMEWRGVMWAFASAEHKAMFEAEPEKFAPQFGGHCAWSMSEGRMSSVDPHAWDIVDGKLYLNYSPGMQAAWRENRAELISKADTQWRKFVDL